MTVETTSRIAGPFTGTGANATLAFGFKCLDATEILVTRDGAPLTLTADYSVSLNADQQSAPGGSVTILAAANTAGAEVIVQGNTSVKQATSLPSQSNWSPKVIEQALDRLTMMVQEARLALTAGDSALRVDLLSNAGASFISFLASASAGAITRTLQTRNRELPLHPEDFGAIGDGTTDDTAAINAAISAAATEGRYLDGRKKTYAVTGKISALSNLRLRDVTLKQLAPGASASVITFQADTKTNLRISGLKVLRNGDGTNGGFAQSSGVNGCLDTAYGIHLKATTYSHFSGLEVTGDDTGTGIKLESLDRTNTIDGLNVHDIHGVNPIATDDNISGVRISYCLGLEVRGLVVNNLTMTYNAGATTNNYYTRGCSYQGNDGLFINGAQISYVDEAHDVSSSNANVDLQIIGGSVSDCAHWGVKVANLAKRIKVTDVVAIRCGAAGFNDSSSLDALGKLTDANVYTNCTARDCGDAAVNSLCAGFLATNGTHTYPNGAIFRDCVAVDERGTPLMRYGFNNQKTASDACLVSFPNCRSTGHTFAEFNTEHEDRCHVSRAANQTLTTGVVTAISFDTEIADTSDIHSTSTNPDAITIRKSGVYEVVAIVAWAGSATGSRTLQLTKNGASITGASSVIPGQAATHTQTLVWVTTRLSKGDLLRVLATHTAGANLDIIGGSGQPAFIVRRLDG